MAYCYHCLPQVQAHLSLEVYPMNSLCAGFFWELGKLQWRQLELLIEGHSLRLWGEGSHILPFAVRDITKLLSLHLDYGKGQRTPAKG